MSTVGFLKKRILETQNAIKYLNEMGRTGRVPDLQEDLTRLEKRLQVEEKRARASIQPVKNESFSSSPKINAKLKEKVV